MTPAARAQAAIEILDLVVAAARDQGAAADTLIQRYFNERRYAGSKDRRAVRELVYAAVRRAGERPVSGRAALLGLADDMPELAPLFDGGAHAPAAISAKEPHSAAGIAPEWLRARLRATLAEEELPALLDRAPLDLRVNRLRADRDTVLAGLGAGAAMAAAPHGIRIVVPIAIDRHPLFLDGSIEVQDEGSQLIVLACRARPGMTVIDLCAGAGGKTLALAADMGGEGRLIAADTDRGRLARLAPRAIRAGADAVETRLLDPGREAAILGDLDGSADVVLVDAPCSGTGTWRRNPEARWRLSPARIDRLVAMQAHILATAARLVRPGGRLVYAVCSLIEEEGAGQAAAFLSEHPEWRAGETGIAIGRSAGAGRLLSPASDATDGFFIAALDRPC